MGHSRKGLTVLLLQYLVLQFYRAVQQLVQLTLTMKHTMTRIMTSQTRKKSSMI